MVVYFSTKLIRFIQFSMNQLILLFNNNIYPLNFVMYNDYKILNMGRLLALENIKLKFRNANVFSMELLDF